MMRIWFLTLCEDGSLAGVRGQEARFSALAPANFGSLSSGDRVASPTMWQLSISWWELILRVVIIYGFLLVLIRLSGKRQVGQLAPFDLVLLLVLSNAVQNAM